jgi:hypothetical protein
MHEEGAFDSTVALDTQGNRVKERMLNPIGKFFAPWGVLDSHRAKFWSTTQSEGFMPCVPSGLRNAADSAKTIHPIALHDRPRSETATRLYCYHGRIRRYPDH